MKKVIIIADSKFNPKNPDDSQGTLYAVPFTEIATEFGNIFNEKYGCDWCNICNLKF